MLDLFEGIKKLSGRGHRDHRKLQKNEYLGKYSEIQEDSLSSALNSLMRLAFVLAMFNLNIQIRALSSNFKLEFIILLFLRKFFLDTFRKN